MKAFISYSHDDAVFLTSLHEHLSALRRQKLIETWTDRQIEAGGVLDKVIESEIKRARLFLLLISSSFINSDYCYNKEFEMALEKQKAGKAIIVPIIIRPCDWKIPELRQFKALPEDGNAILSKYWHSHDEAFADVANGLRVLLENHKKKSVKFVANESHISSEQRDQLKKVHEEIVKRLISKKAHQEDDIVKAEYGKWAGIVWSQFHKKFGTKKNGLQSLERTHFDEAKSWLLQYRASNDRKLKRTNPQAYRAPLTRTIYTVIKQLGWTKEQLYEFAAEKLSYQQPISSLNDLGNSQLELVRDKVRYEATKSKSKIAQARAKRTPKASPNDKRSEQ